MRQGICIAGNMIVDIHYPIEGWPSLGELVHIKGRASRATGGCVNNTLMDIARLAPDMKLFAMGRVGTDAEGDLILNALRQYPSIDTSNVIQEGETALTLVFNDHISTNRTFFTYGGSNAEFDVEDVDWDRLSCNILHVGYILLLEALDREDPEYGTRMARLLCLAQQHGIKTSVDVVSEASHRFERIVRPALKYTDYCVINEFEASRTTGIPLRDEQDNLILGNMEQALRCMKSLGVSTWAVIHCPEGGFGLDENDRYIALPSLQLPDGFIKGSNGAGDAFCAGVLYSAEKGRGLEEAMRVGIATAAASMTSVDACNGVQSEEVVLKLYDRYPTRVLK